MKFKYTIILITNNLIYFCASLTNTVERKRQSNLLYPYFFEHLFFRLEYLIFKFQLLSQRKQFFNR